MPFLNGNVTFIICELVVNDNYDHDSFMRYELQE